MNKWKIIFAPRNVGDKKPWLMQCPNEIPEWLYHEQGGRWCYCKRFPNGRKAISFFNRRVRENYFVVGQ